MNKNISQKMMASINFLNLLEDIADSINLKDEKFSTHEIWKGASNKDLDMWKNAIVNSTIKLFEALGVKYTDLHRKTEKDNK